MMPRLAGLLDRYRLALLAVALSAAVHAAILVGMPRRIAAIDEATAIEYSATLDPAAIIAAPPPVAAPQPAAPRPRAPARKRLAPAISPDILAMAPLGAVTDASPVLDAAPELAPTPELVALAQPAVPVVFEPPKFPVAALPASISISYQITSAFADGRAVYSWEREGDSYRISGEAEAEGFFTLFLEGQIRQESNGMVTESGLRPERFVETRPNNVREGLEFDWPARKVTFERTDSKRTTPLTDNTVDWLSMIFQLAHMPPHGESMNLQVFTQRKMYKFALQVMGTEEIEIPLGKVRALHLRHVDEKDSREAVDVWLGIDYHNLPVKLRFPVARNRLMVEQVATRVTTR
jgi:hypothetical protein